MSDKVFSDSTFTATAERYADSWNEFSTLNMQVFQQEDNSFMESFFDALNPVFHVLTYVAVAFLIFMLLMIVYKQRGWFSGLFSRENKAPEDISSSSSITNIYGHDYDFEIANCLSNEQYAEAIRLVYLKTLYYLQRHNCISWNESKTATEYYYEYRNVKRRPVFHELIGLYFVAVYADNSERPITKSDYLRARELNQIITKL